MRNKIVNRLRMLRFNRVCKQVLKTQSIKTDDSALMFVSMVSHSDLLNYIMAIKSIYRFFKMGRITIIDDGSLTTSDSDVLDRHIDHFTVLKAEQVNTSPCPSGGCWERLLTICSLAKDYYVIQVDSDLLAVAPISEIVDAYRDNVAFTQSGGGGHKIVDAKQAASFAHTQSGSHVQTFAERALASLPASAGQRYVRGSAGFSGFPRGYSFESSVKDFSIFMSQALGAEKWREWGSEQVASNYIVANCPGSFVLDSDRYLLHWADCNLKEPALIHFVGAFRYHFDTYRRYARRVNSELSKDA